MDAICSAIRHTISLLEFGHLTLVTNFEELFMPGQTHSYHSFCLLNNTLASNIQLFLYQKKTIPIITPALTLTAKKISNNADRFYTLFIIMHKTITILGSSSIGRNPFQEVLHLVITKDLTLTDVCNLVLDIEISLKNYNNSHRLNLLLKQFLE